MHKTKIDLRDNTRKAVIAVLQEYPHDIADGPAHVEALSGALAAFGKRVRAAIDEADKIGHKDSADVFTEISRGLDHQLWLVEAHAQAKR